MAKAKSSTKKAPKKSPKTKIKFDTRVKVVLGLLCLFIALFAGISMISFLFTWQADQSFLDQVRSESLIDSSIMVENWAGKAGAIISNLLIYQWFGVPSMTLVIILVLGGFELLGTHLLPFWRSIKYTLLLVFWSSVTLAFSFGKTNFLLGGGHGKYMSEWLESFLGPAGTIAFIILTGLALIVFLFRITPELLQIRSKPEAVFDSGEFDDIKESRNKKKKKEHNAGEVKEEEGFLVSEKAPDEEMIEGLDDLSISKSVDENDKISVDFNSDIQTETPKEEEREPVEPEMTIDHAHERAEEKVSKNKPDLGDDFDPTKDLSEFKFPALDLLRDHSRGNTKVSDEELISNKNFIFAFYR